MKYTDTELETILSKLIASTRSPRGRFSAVASYPQLEKRLKPHIRCLFPTRMRILAAAAAVILLCLSVGTVYLYMQPTSLQTVSTMAETRNVILPDGSSVLLNRHSSLSYPKRFKSDNREVQLTGEAYFEVSKDQKHPFIVQTEHINVQVLGTHFNVDAYRNNPEVKTTLLTGSVAVSNKSNSVRMILKPNEIAIYNKVGNKLTRQVTKNAKDEISWRDGVYIRQSSLRRDRPRTVQFIRYADSYCRHVTTKLSDFGTIPQWRRLGNNFICTTSCRLFQLFTK